MIAKNKLVRIYNLYKYSFASLGMTFLVGFIIFGLNGRLFDNKYTFVHSDMINQMIPMIKMFYRQLLCKHNITYSFDFGMGSSTLAAYANGSCFSPFNIIYLLPININIASFIAVFSKLSLGAFAFSELVKRVFNKQGILTVALSVIYGLCGFNLAYYYVIIWQDGIYLLPIIILLLFALIKKKRSPLLIFAYTFLFVFNFYSGYVIGIYSFILFVLYLLFINKEDGRTKIAVMFRYILYVLMAIMLSAVILLPTAITIIRSFSSESIGFENTIINILDLIKQFYVGQAYDENGYYPYCYSGLLPFVMCPLFFVNNKINKRIKIVYGCLLFLLVFCSVTLPGYMFIHAFNAPDNFGHRYAYLYTFTLLIMFIHIDDFENIKKKYYILISAIYIGFIIFYTLLQKVPSYVVDNSNKTSTVLINAIFILLYALVIIYVRNKKQLYKIIAVLILFELCINGYIYKDIASVSLYENKSFFDYFYNEEKSLIDQVPEEDGYRISVPNALIYNNSQMMGYRGLEMFSSLLNPKLSLVLRRLGYRSNNLLISDEGTTSFCRIIFGQKYIVEMSDFSNEQKGEETGEILKSEALPIAFMSSRDVLNFSPLDNSNPFENQNEFATSLCGEKIKCFYNVGQNINIDYNNVIMGMAENKDEQVTGFELENELENGFIEFFDESGECEYAYFDMFDSYAYSDSPYVACNLDTYKIGFRDCRLSEPRIIKMDRYGDKSAVYLIMDSETSANYYYKTAYFYSTNQSEIDRVYDILSEGSMNIKMFKDGCIKGNVCSNKDKDILFTSIPYDENWNVYIDGKKSKTIPLLDGAFVGVEIPEGNHEIELRFIDGWILKGGIVSLFGVVFTAIICWLGFKNNNNINISERMGNTSEE